jgi:hypothetical protein
VLSLPPNSSAPDWQQPIVARRTGEVIAGNTRLKAAQSLGMTEVPVWWFEGSGLDALSFAIADNRPHEHAEWNEAELAQILEQPRKEDALDGVGYSTDDIDALVAQLRADEDRQLTDDGPDEPPAVAVAKLGAHRSAAAPHAKTVSSTASLRHFGNRASNAVIMRWRFTGSFSVTRVSPRSASSASTARRCPDLSR